MELLAASAGQLIGTSLSPEMWVAVVAVVAFARSRRTYFVALAIAGAALVGTRAAIIPNYQVLSAAAGIAALGLWSAIGVGLRAFLTCLAPTLVKSILGTLRKRQQGYIRSLIVVLCGWLGFVIWNYIEWKPFFNELQSDCVKERVAKPALGNLYECYVNPDPTRFGTYMRDKYPLEYFAYFHIEIALLPVLLLAVMTVAWVVAGFRQRPTDEPR